MYTINFDKYINILNWDVIYYGIEKDLIESMSAINYVNKLIDLNLQQVSDEIIDILILDSADKATILNQIKKLTSQNVKQGKVAERILRYVILDEIRTSGQTSTEILSSIETVYAEFDYPADMDGFITYMPEDDNSYDNEDSNVQNNEIKLINRFNDFMKNEMILLGLK